MTSIITGDIINSRNSDIAHWLPILKSKLNEIGNTPESWEIFRGDSFQIEIKDVSESLLFALKLKTAFKKMKNLDIRIAIGIGDKNFHTTHITQANGEAFINSGFAFDNLLKRQSLAIKSPFIMMDEIINTSLSLALLIIDNWTINSAEFVEMCMLFPNETQKTIAKKIGISESSASERKKRAGFNEIQRLEKLYRTLIEKNLQ